MLMRMISKIKDEYNLWRGWREYLSQMVGNYCKSCDTEHYRPNFKEFKFAVYQMYSQMAIQLYMEQFENAISEMLEEIERASISDELDQLK